MALLLPAAARADVADLALQDYARARLADSKGDPDTALANYRQALAIAPDSLLIALRSYRQAVESGDMALAVRSARILDASGNAPSDALLLMLTDALARKDWKGARAFTGRMEEGNFAFAAPIVRSWISVASGPYRPPQLDPADRFANLARRYLSEQVALQQLARGKADAAIMELDKTLAQQTDEQPGLRMIAAARLASLGRKDKAIAYLRGDDPLLADFRMRIARGGKLPLTIATPAQGLSRLFFRLSEDLSSDNTQRLALTLVRLATFGDPANGEYRIAAAEQLIKAGQADGALAEIDKVAPGSPFALLAEDGRIDGLLAAGRNDEALGLAKAAAGKAGAGSADYLRLANIYTQNAAYGDAANAYERAVGFYGDGVAPWTLYLLRGSALERAGRWEDARASLQEAMKIAPDEPVVLNYLGYAQVERREDMSGALALIRKASLLKPDDPSITDSLGWAHYIAGNAAAAVPVLEKAAVAAPDDVTINEHLGDALWAVGRRFEARYAWSAARVFADDAVRGRIDEKITLGLKPEFSAH